MIEVTGRSIYDLARYRILLYPLAAVFLIHFFLSGAVKLIRFHLLGKV